MKLFKNLKYILTISGIILIYGTCNTWSFFNKKNASLPLDEWGPCRVQNMGGEQPSELCQVREFLKMLKGKQQKDKKNLPKGPSALLFYGPSGTGKTMGVKNMAAEADVVLDFQDIKALIEFHGNNLPNELIKIYEVASEKAKNEKKPVIILFDDTSTKGDMGNTLLLLNTILDRNFDNPLVITIFTSNCEISSFDDSLKNRCALVSWQMPDKDKRIEIIKFCNRKFDGTLTPEIIEKLAKKYSGFSCREIVEAFEKAIWLSTNNQGVLLIAHIEQAFKEKQAKKDIQKGFWIKIWLALFWPFKWN